MKMIYVSGDGDYAAIAFENFFNRKSVKEIIDTEFTENTSSISYETDDGDFEIELYDFDVIDPEFISFVRREVLDYDMAKHSNFYFENEIIRA